METNNTYHLLSVILKLLKTFTEAGAEIYRVEESARHIFEAYGFKNEDIYVTTSNIIISVEAEDDVIKTHTKRIEKITTDIEKIDALNSLVRNITLKKPTYEYIDKELEKIEHIKRYPPVVTVIFYGIIAGAFYLFFGGKSVVELLLSTFIGICTGLLNLFFDKLDFNKILGKFVLSFVSALFAAIFEKIGIASNIECIIIANIMTLIPGIGITNSLRDLFVGDNISGVLRLIEAGISALAIACGYVAVSALFGGAL